VTVPKVDRRWGVPIRAAGLLVLTGLPTIPGLANAGAWTREQGSLYARLSVNRYTSDREFGADSRRARLPLEGRFSDTNLGSYVEYGLTDRFTAVASFSVKSLESDNVVRVIETRGIGDVDLALRSRLLEGRAGVASVQFLSKIPSGYDVDVNLPLGNGETEFDLRLLYGRSLPSGLPGYFGLEAGYRWRSGAPSDEFRYLVEIGSDLGGDFYARSKLDGIRGRRNDAAVDESGNPTVRATADLGVLDLTVGRRLGTLFSIEAGFAPALYGRTTTSGSTLSLAVAYTLSPTPGDETP
jgi:hypothetical protein